MNEGDRDPCEGKIGLTGRIWSIPARLARLVRSHGLMGGIGLQINYAVDYLGDRRFGVKTSEFVQLKERGIADENCIDHSPIHYLALRTALKRSPRMLGVEDVFVDFGCGLGRVLLEIGRSPVRRVIGIEFLADLASRAEHNIAEADRRGHLLCSRVEVYTQRAESFEIPDDASVVHFYNPFRGEILDQVFANLAESLRRNPRRVTVMFANPDDFGRVLEHQVAFPKMWIYSDVRFVWPLYRKVEGEAGNCYRIIEIEPD